MANTHRYHKTCDRCGADFIGGNIAKYCPTCRPEAYRDLERARRANTDRPAGMKRRPSNADQARLQQAYGLITEGMTKRELAHAIGLPNTQSIDGFLATMEYNGFRLWENAGKIGKVF